MKRFHVHVSVADLQASIRFYSALFAAQPTLVKEDYAKWMLDDPRLNFAISSRGAASDPGVDHLGFQVETEDELADMHARLAAAELPLQAQIGANCCYAKSDKYWSVDPQGIAWESYRTLASIPTFGRSRQDGSEGATCRTPASETGEPASKGGCASTSSCC